MPALSAPAGGASTLADRLGILRRRIEAAGGDPGTVQVLAVTKGFGPEAVAESAAIGLADVGENYAAELAAKAAAASSEGLGVRWHFLGGIQRNKVRRLAPLVECWQSVARTVEGEEIARHRPGAGVLVQVDTTGSPGRNGCAPDEVARLVGQLRSLPLAVRGLMTVAPRPPEPPGPTFAAVRRLADQLDLPERSMGMTDDLEAAVAEGTTMVRVSRALFGARPARRSAP